MEFNFKEFFFLTDCYGQRVDERAVYKQFLMKYACDRGAYEGSLVHVQTEIRTKYGVEIPINFIESLFADISTEYDSITCAGGTLRIRAVSQDLQQNVATFSTKFEAVVGRIKEEFNNHLHNCDMPPVTIGGIYEYLDHVRDRMFATSNVSETLFAGEQERIFFDWIYTAYAHDYPITEDLNLLLYSLLVYTYFSQASNQSGVLLGKRFYLDTNLIILLFGVNGEVRKRYVEELLVMLEKQRAEICVADATLVEIRALLKAEAKPEIRMFKLRAKDLALQLALNTKDVIRGRIKHFGLAVRFERGNVEEHRSAMLEWENLVSSLRAFKSDNNRRQLNEASLDHDINLIYLARLYDEEPGIIGREAWVITADTTLVAWFKKEISQKRGESLTGLESLYNLTLWLWIENQHRTDSRFVANTWMFVCDSIPYFKEESVNNIFRVFRDQILETPSAPLTESWRAIYVLVGRELPDEQDFVTTTEEQMLEAVATVKNTLLETTMRDKDRLEEENRLLSQEVTESRAANRLLHEKLGEQGESLKSERKATRSARQKNYELKTMNQSLRQDRKFREEFERRPILTTLRRIAKQYSWVGRVLSWFGLWPPNNRS